MTNRLTHLHLQALLLLCSSIYLYSELLYYLTDVLMLSDTAFYAWGYLGRVFLGGWAAFLITRFEDSEFWFWSLKLEQIGEIVLTLLTSAVWSFFYSLIFPITTINQQNLIEMAQGTNWWNQHFFSFYIMIIAPIREEIIYRGLIFSLFKPFKKYHLDLLASAICFSLLHLDYGQAHFWTDFVKYLGFGLILAWCFKKTKSIYCPIIVHITWNTFGFLVTRG